MKPTPRAKSSPQFVGALATFYVPIAALILLAVLSWWSLNRIRASEELVARLQEELLAFKDMMSTLKDAETGQRGYLLTGDPEYLEPFHTAKSQLNQRLVELENVLDTNVGISFSTSRLRATIADKFADMQSSIELVTAGRRDDAIATLDDNAGQKLMEAIRTSVSEAEAELEGKLAGHHRSARLANFAALTIMAFAFLLALSSVVWSILRSNQELRWRQDADAENTLRARQVQSLADIVARVISARDTLSVFGIALNEFRQLCGAAEAVAVLYDLQGGKRYERNIIAVDSGKSDESFLENLFHVARLSSGGQTAFMRTRQQLMDDANVTGSEAWKACQRDIKGILVVTLNNPAREETGRLLLNGKVGGEFDDNDLSLATQLASTVSVAIENARLTGEAIQQSRRKDEFLAMLGHELRNPLSAILAGSESLKDESTSDADQNEIAAAIYRQSRLMSDIVDDLLDVSRIAQGKITLNKTASSLHSLIDDAVDGARRAASNREIQVEFDRCLDDYQLVADRSRITQCIGNLVHNACKFSPESTPVRVVVSLVEEQQPSLVDISVTDQGIGLTPKELEEIFELFRQSSTTIDRNQGGLGLGLTLSRALCELHGGRLNAASPGQGRGSTFSMRLPIFLLIEDEDDQEGDDERPSHSQTANGHSAEENSLTILAIDDRRDALLPIRVLLTRAGHTVEEAHDGVSGFQKAVKVRPDVILCDIGLPGKMNGYDVARAVRKSPEIMHTYMVAISGYSQPADRAAAREAGFDFHVAKPIDADTLMSLVGERPSTRGE